jgi:shikimate 5-dehydrogenase
VTILNRSPLKAMGLLATFGLKGDVVALDAPIPPVALLVNASSLGMVGHPPLDLDLSNLPEDALVYDAVYAPLETGLLAGGAGARAGDGRRAGDADRAGGAGVRAVLWQGGAART